MVEAAVRGAAVGGGTRRVVAAAVAAVMLTWAYGSTEGVTDEVCRDSEVMAFECAMAVMRNRWGAVGVADAVQHLRKLGGQELAKRLRVVSSRRNRAAHPDPVLLAEIDVF